MAVTRACDLCDGKPAIATEFAILRTKEPEGEKSRTNRAKTDRNPLFHLDLCGACCDGFAVAISNLISEVKVGSTKLPELRDKEETAPEVSTETSVNETPVELHEELPLSGTVGDTGPSEEETEETPTMPIMPTETSGPRRRDRKPASG
jgi:hypothetical protein